MAKNESLDYIKNRLFGDFLNHPGLTEIAVNRPNELLTKIKGVWELHEINLSLDECHKFARVLANYHGDYIADIKPVFSSIVESGERGQVILPPACQRDKVSITLRKPSMVELSHQSYIDKGFYERVVGKSSSGSHNEELLQLYNNKNIRRFIEKCME
ncbi:Type IV secretion system protein VirB11 [Arsenophonus endosymbiont of Bemisia tabaci Q2]|nr:Flp pilus assembly complex ATPase component TadA [Arsenophonus endosymbiont of Bemisia tabaci]CAA2929433.1 Type IV secretion system protein VirB11 [Arsenophonus endosymbiont of Bemisia tabaci Q2]